MIDPCGRFHQIHDANNCILGDSARFEVVHGGYFVSFSRVVSRKDIGLEQVFRTNLT
jgi:hypothetical protein